MPPLQLMHRCRVWPPGVTAIAVCARLVTFQMAQAQEAETYDVVIAGGRLVDGTGNP